ncbi:Cystatin-B [Clonorchis sinensis]|uniref:Cystatin-1 n=1 Tax=Clonorchis sinensis TaxID=79923 RepID=A6YID9_CLOSI|nr:Chain A, Cystatin-1 [Clonorchis sinensis]5ZC1_B Chain B, Cystatin-1 [Clonorchis sinensis]5ZC1_C Chain C, Cystatin-1 [Clonorchis sinensis]5ZC1_D Chain D, Cystatin-1 [Clonorchis sinensis]5ZC1_E Chain E, Cystatin-1 [Clonorchis sinensis]5ZC1_F Chain F, Cystatin-1 [Clonorchis sinensis]ABR68548.1 cystatin-1 [Clonorchis sinensis]KAG5454881.1 Cystatin-B [Clonorchis sinensis]
MTSTRLAFAWRELFSVFCYLLYTSDILAERHNNHPVMPICGGISAARIPTADEKKKLEPVLLQSLYAHLGSKPTSAEVVLVATQVVAGTNYFAKVKVNNDHYIHTRVYEQLPCYGGALELHSVQMNKTDTDPLDYF